MTDDRMDNLASKLASLRDRQSSVVKRVIVSESLCSESLCSGDHTPIPKVDDALYCSQGGETSWRVKKDWKHISGQTHWSQAQFPPEEVR